MKEIFYNRVGEKSPYLARPNLHVLSACPTTLLFPPPCSIFESKEIQCKKNQINR